jgi:hypothetical protein
MVIVALLQRPVPPEPGDDHGVGASRPVLLRRSGRAYLLRLPVGARRW